MYQLGDQAKQRRYQKFPDQHKRLWGAPVEHKTGDPCGPLDPVGWTAPLLPPSEFMQIVRDPETLMPRIEILYDAWISRMRQDIADWDKRARKAMVARYNEKYVASMPTDDDIVEALGQRPSISKDITPGTIQPIIAAKQGNKWVLGLTPVEDTRVSKFFLTAIPLAEMDYSGEYEPLPDEKYGEYEEQHDPDPAPRSRGGRPRKPVSEAA